MTIAGDSVTLTDLQVIQRWSLAVRQGSASRAEIVEALRADLAWLEADRQDARAAADDDESADVAGAETLAPRTRRAPARKSTSATTAKKTARSAARTTTRATTTTKRSR